jgi:serine/threonine-protein phosphatase PGAM5
MSKSTAPVRADDTLSMTARRFKKQENRRKDAPHPCPQEVLSKKPHLRVLHFLRHAAHDTSQDGQVPGAGLTALGRKQAKAAGRYLRNLPIEIVYTSDLRRTIETTDVVISELANTVPVKRSRLLREDMVAAPPGQRWDQQKRLRAKTHFERIWMKFFRPARRKTVHELLVTHGNLIRCLVTMALKVQRVSVWTTFRTYNCALTTFIVDNAGMVDVSTVNNIGYLPRRLVTESSDLRSTYMDIC